MKIIFDHANGHVLNDRVFCEAFVIPEGEKEYELLELGFLPSVQPPVYWYQSKSCRVDSNNLKLSYKRRKIISKLSYEILNYNSIKEETDKYFLSYMENKNLDFLDYYKKNSEFFKLNILKVKQDDEIVAYVRFQDLDKVLLGMETAYDTTKDRLSLGTNCIVLLSLYGNSIGKQYTYIYESYDDYFPYKMTIPGVEYWEGEKWLSP